MTLGPDTQDKLCILIALCVWETSYLGVPHHRLRQSHMGTPYKSAHYVSAGTSSWSYQKSPSQDLMCEASPVCLQQEPEKTKRKSGLHQRAISWVAPCSVIES